ncbi:HD domain-containing protein [Sulfurospirillum sp. T05]|uniref:HD domain-containing protein n=2 Tax=Sulfurospirillum tamanense TaxID=2813362 RepID=A0ABS2WTX2_9BACT|nr:HD domain-containing protein [Sulfurospirillum tamanensis]
MMKPYSIYPDQFFSTFKKIISKLGFIKNSKRHEGLLREYKEAIDRSAIVSKTDPKGTITYVNDAFCTISQYSAQELLGKPHNIIRHPDMPALAFEEMWHTITSKRPWGGVVKNRKKDGTAYYVKSLINPILNEHGEIEEFIAIRHDVTELEMYRQDLETRLQESVDEIVQTQREILYTVGAIGEKRSKETGLHVKRVAHYSYVLAKLYGLDEKQAQLLREASPMHDIGKVGIPDSVLLKPGPLDDEEWAIIKTHPTLGYEMLKHSNREILQAAAIIAHEHHERWDGKGYPRGLKDEEIHIFGRITAIADVYDALGHDRVYKKAWSLAQIQELFHEEKGRGFDPVLSELFLTHIHQFETIKSNLSPSFF